MLRLVGVVVTIALVDSLNPSTIGPAIYLASGERARRSVLEFIIAVLLTHLAGGVLLTIGPGPLRVSLIRGLDPTLQHLAELALGAGIAASCRFSWWRRQRPRPRALHRPQARPL